MTSARFQEGWRTLRFMFLSTLIVIACVSALHLASRNRIRMFEDLHLQKCILIAARIPIPANSAELVAVISNRIQAVPWPEKNSVYYQVRDPMTHQVAGYVFKEVGQGLWGEVEAVVGLDANGEYLTGIEILKHNETPGLGARIEESAFKDQFRGKRGPLSMHAGSSPAPETEFDAITGATQSSRAVLQIINQALLDAREQIQREKQAAAQR